MPDFIDLDLCQEHASLLDHLSGLEAMIESAHAGIMAEHMCAIREHLLHHFQFEERDGYMKDVLVRAPQRHDQVQELLAEHDRMRKEVDQLVADAPTFAPDRPPPDAFRHQARLLMKEIRQHEAKENRLVQETAYLELGTKD